MTRFENSDLTIFVHFLRIYFNSRNLFLDGLIKACNIYIFWDSSYERSILFLSPSLFFLPIRIATMKRIPNIKNGLYPGINGLEGILFITTTLAVPIFPALS